MNRSWEQTLLECARAAQSLGCWASEVGWGRGGGLVVLRSYLITSFSGEGGIKTQRNEATRPKSHSL